MPLPFPSLLAVHISDGVLAWTWLAAGFIVAAHLLLPSLYRLEPEEIPRIALLSAAFFVASLIHVRVGPTSVHLLLNGLVGVFLAWRAPLAIAEGLLLQAILIGHGGLTTLGVNTCILALPALLVGVTFPRLHAWVRRRGAWVRGVLAAGAVGLWLLGAVAAAEMIVRHFYGSLDFSHLTWGVTIVLHPITLAAVGLTAAAAGVLEKRLDPGREFALGLFIGEFAVLLTVGLNFLVLLLGGVEDWRTLAVLIFAAHLPVAVIEGLIVGFAVPYVLRVDPRLVRCEAAAPANLHAEVEGGNTSSSGTSH